MKFLPTAVVALSGLILVSPAFADNRDFDLINATGYPIKGVYMDVSASRSWGYENELSNQLQDGETIRITFGRGDGRSCMWDLKVVWADDSADDVWTNINVCTANSIKLRYNRNSNETTAEID